MDTVSRNRKELTCASLLSRPTAVCFVKIRKTVQYQIIEKKIHK
jgi:hypothetical protein